MTSTYIAYDSAKNHTDYSFVSYRHACSTQIRQGLNQVSAVLLHQGAEEIVRKTYERSSYYITYSMVEAVIVYGLRNN